MSSSASRSSLSRVSWLVLLFPITCSTWLEYCAGVQSMPAGIPSSLTGTASFWTETTGFRSALISWCCLLGRRNLQWFKCVLLLSLRLLVYLMSCLWMLHYKILKSLIPLGEKLVCGFWSLLYSEWEYQIKLDRGWCSEALEKQVGGDLKCTSCTCEYFVINDCNMQNSW